MIRNLVEYNETTKEQIEAFAKEWQVSKRDAKRKLEDRKTKMQYWSGDQWIDVPTVKMWRKEPTHGGKSE